MGLEQRFKDAAAEFLINSDVYYSECSRGLANLDRIIVACPSFLEDVTRGYCVVILYAYWERFFKQSLTEFLRCIGMLKVELWEVNRHLAKMCLKDTLKATGDTHALKLWIECANKSPLEMQKIFMDLAGFVSKHVSFPQNREWVDTGNNVNFKILLGNLERFGIDSKPIIDGFSNPPLKDALDGLVDDRNEIAHGGTFQTFTTEQYAGRRDLVLKLMSSLQIHLHATIENAGQILEQPQTDSVMI